MLCLKSSDSTGENFDSRSCACSSAYSLADKCSLFMGDRASIIISVRKTSSGVSSTSGKVTPEKQKTNQNKQAKLI